MRHTATAILVSIIPLASLAQSPVQYEARVGDLNGDGTPDFFIERSHSVPIQFDGMIVPIPVTNTSESAVLQHSADGGYTLIAGLTGGQLATVTGWPRAQSIILSYGDFNLDGKNDVLLKGVSTVIPNGTDVIAYTGSSYGSPPSAVRAVTPDFQQFFLDLRRWIADPEYFASGYRLLCTVSYSWSYGWQYDDYAGLPFYASFLDVVPICDTVFDASGFSQTAVQLAGIFSGTAPLSASSQSAVQTAVDNVAGTDVPIEDIDTPDAAESARVLGRLFAWADVILVALEMRGDTEEYFLHYTNSGALPAILASGSLDPPNSDFVYFTTDVYFSAALAQNRLSLSTTPSGYFPFLESQIPPPVVYGGIVAPEPEFGTSGGGTQWVAHKPVPLPPGRRFILIGP